MGAAIPSLQAGLLNQSSAQVIDGSLKFKRNSSSSGSYLSRTPSSGGNRTKFTMSAWVKRSANFSEWQRIFAASPGGSTVSGLAFRGDGNTDGLRLQNQTASWNSHWTSTGKFRDSNGWYHIVMSVDLNLGSGERQKIYINAVRDVGSYNPGAEPTSSQPYYFNNSGTEHRIGSSQSYPTPFDGYMSQFYWIDGQALGPESFGFTDPLTNTWRPKKFSVPTPVASTELLYNVNTSDNGFDTSSTSRTYDAASRTFATYTTPQSANQGGVGANAAHVYKSPTGSAITWVVSTDTTDRYIWTSSNGVNWSSSGSYYDTDSSPQSVTSVYIALAAGSNASNVTVTSSTSGIGQVGSGINSFYLPMDGNSPIGEDKSGRGNNWTPVNFGGSNSLDKATGALPILNTDGGGNVARVGVRTDANAANLVLALPLIDNGAGGTTQDFSNQINAGSTTKASTTTGSTDSTSAQSVFYNRSFVLDGNGDDIRVPDDADFNFGSGDSTIEMWIYPTRISGTQENIMTRGTSGYSGFIMSVTNFLDTVNGSSWGVNITYDNPLIANAWQHIAVCRSGNTWTVYINGIANGSATASGSVQASAQTLTIGQRTGQTDFQGYMSDIRIYKGVAKYTSNFIVPATSPDILPDTPSGVSGGSKLTKITDGAVSFDGSGDSLSIADNADFDFGSGDFTVELFTYNDPAQSSNPVLIGATGGWYLQFKTGGTIVEFYTGSTSIQATGLGLEGGWHHIAVTKASNVVKIFIDGILKSTTSNSDTTNLASTLYIGNLNGASLHYLGFISNVRVIKGTALYTTSFNPPTRTLTNVTNTKLLCCQSNTSATAAAVTPGSITANGDAAATTFNPFTTDINAVRGQETGYCTFNVLRERTAGYNPTFRDGNLFMDGRGDGTGTLSAQSGKFYFEVFIDTVTTSGQIYLGVQDAAYSGTERGWSTAQIAAMRDTNTLYGNGATGSGVTYGVGDLMSFAFDTDNNKLYIAKNGIYLNGGNPSQGTGFTHSGISFVGGYTPIVSDSQTGQKYRLNCGQKPFKFPPPAGFQPLNAANVRPETVIVRPDQFVQTTIWSGNDSNPRGISTPNLKPDLVWIKTRNAGYHHGLFDSVRGAGGAKRLYSDQTYAEGGTAGAEGTAYGELSAFNNGGFTVNTGTTSDIWVNNSGNTYVAWSWKAGGNKNTFNVDDVGYASAAAAGITEGTISLTGASIGTKQGFSIVSYSGSGSNGTFGHGLLETPNLIIVKCRNVAQNWAVQHSAYGPTKYTYLNSANEARTTGATAFWNNTAPTTSTVSVGTDNDTNASGSGRIYIAYCWHDVPGLQKFGQYTGVNSTDGPFLELGFRPSIIMFKNISSGSTEWVILDNKRNGFNGTAGNNILFPSISGAENATQYGDFLSNGWKFRINSSYVNSTDTFIYAAWAEAPIVNLYGAQSNAR